MHMSQGKNGIILLLAFVAIAGIGGYNLEKIVRKFFLKGGEK